MCQLGVNKVEKKVQKKWQKKFKELILKEK